VLERAADRRAAERRQSSISRAVAVINAVVGSEHAR